MTRRGIDPGATFAEFVCLRNAEGNYRSNFMEG